MNEGLIIVVILEVVYLGFGIFVVVVLLVVVCIVFLFGGGINWVCGWVCMWWSCDVVDIWCGDVGCSYGWWGMSRFVEVVMDFWEVGWLVVCKKKGGWIFSCVGCKLLCDLCVFVCERESSSSIKW